VLEAIRAAGAVYKPIIVDAETLTVVDGHHRLAALKLIGARRAPVLLVDYEAIVEAILPARAPPHPRVLAAAAHGDVLGAYEALARLRPPEQARTQRIPPPEPWMVRELAARRLLLPPRTTIHVTPAKAVVAPAPLRLLL